MHLCFCVFVCVYKTERHTLFLKFFDWASMHPTQSELQEKLEATGRRRLRLHIVELPYISSDMCHLSLSLSAAFLGDIALDEEDLRSFKVDRIIDLAQRTVHIVNHTDAGNDNTNQHYKCYKFL